ncbi:Arabinanase/levansucrase/invertase [Marasmius fiardii PR-910]|nr:Arabinanase/levansucrase/invertase [Marasmius fiardii PR-910]
MVFLPRLPTLLTLCAASLSTLVVAIPRNGTLETRAGTFTNPLNPSTGADPCMRYINGRYFFTSTQNVNIQMKSATTIEGLKSASPIVLFSDNTSSRNHNFWAPEFWYLDGTWYLYYSVAGNNDDATHRLHVARGGTNANDPTAGTYSYVASLIPPNLTNQWAADGSILELGGSRYLIFSSFQGSDQCTFIVRMTSPTTITGNAVAISCPTLSWEKSGNPVQEGPEAITINGVTHIVYSASFCGTDDYALGMLTLNSGADPMSASSWVKSSNPLFSKDPSVGVYGPGHHFMFQKGSAWYFAYHAKPGPNQGCGSARTTRVQPFSISGNNPVFPKPVATGVPIAEP